jgi:adenine phosphoribosyltransferase
MDFHQHIRSIPDFPQPGIIFRDITPLLADAEALSLAIKQMAEPFRASGVQKVAAIEARGFLFGAAVALSLGVGFVPVRKKGKLPWKTISESYSLEYGSTVVEVHEDAFRPGEKILVVDDLLATGGTVNAVRKLVEREQATVCGYSFLIELDGLNGRSTLNAPVQTVMHY